VCSLPFIIISSFGGHGDEFNALAAASSLCGGAFTISEAEYVELYLLSGLTDFLSVATKTGGYPGRRTIDGPAQ